jgi:molybdenum cofactor cytidylyltransferase
MNSVPTVIVLAAGQGQRFSGNGHKLAQVLGANTVLGATLEKVLASHLPVLVVTTAALAGVASQHVAACDVLVLPDSVAGRGMGHSIAAGVAARANAHGWLLLPGDMPLVRPTSLHAVARALALNAAAYAQHRGRRGHPVGFGPELYTELTSLTGDEGARRILARFPALAVDVADAGVLVDIDTVEDLQGVKQQWAQATLPQG